MILYYNGPAANHGCEAIVRSTRKLLSDNFVLASFYPDLDRAYGLESLVQITENRTEHLKKGSLKWLAYAIHHKLTGSEEMYTKFSHRDFFSKVKKGDICLSVGGDNYCYGNQQILAHYNRILHARGAKTVLWGCSVEPELMHDKAITQDLALYDLITARETISYEALKAVNPNTVLVSDPAFVLDRVDLPLPEGWAEGNTIGINASPMILSSGDEELILASYQKLVKQIIDNTDCTIALIPHVVIPENDDRQILQLIFEQFRYTGRILLLDDHNCEELKGYIARCKFFIGARTHATIAAYSSCVPTLVTGYSVKSRGIARDIFGTEESYVVPVQSITSDRQLAEAFRYLWEREEDIRQYLQKTMPEYIANAEVGVKAIRKLATGGK